MNRQYAKINNICLIILAGTAITVALIYTKSVLVPFVIAFFLYTVISPVIRFFNKRLKLPHPVMVILAAILFLLAAAVIIIFIFSSFNSFFQDAALYKAKIIEFTTWLKTSAASYGYDLGDLSIESQIKKLSFFSMAGNITKAAGVFMGNFMLVIVFLFFLLLGETATKVNGNKLVNKIKHNISRYAITKLLTSLITGILIFIILVSFRIELAFLFGVLTVLFNFIPTIGSIIATVLPAPVVLLQYGPGWQLIAILSASIVIQFTIGNVIEPKLMGERMDLHPITILLFLVFWGLVWGLPGMFMAVPITAIIKIILYRLEATRVLAELMAGRMPDR